MLSPGDCWKRVPTTARKNVEYRRWLVRRAVANRRNRQAILDTCKHDLLFYVNTFAWTHHPKSKTRVVPFLTYPFQVRAFRNILDHIDKQKDLVLEKSRDMGASWMCILAMEWLWHFHERTQCLMISREGELVDGKTPDALFWKIDFVHDHLPEWMMPRGWNPSRHRLKRFFDNPETRSTMTGQATTEKSGIGGRATVMFADEFSRIDKDYDVLYGTADTADCRIFNSTHTGTGTAFYGLTVNGVTDKLVMHWSEHPVKSRGMYRFDQETGQVVVLDPQYHYDPDFAFCMDTAPNGGPCPGIRSPWYDGECIRRGSARAIAMDLDINPRGSMAQFFDAHMIRRLQTDYALEPVWQGDISFDRETGKPTAMVPSPSGSVKLWCRLDMHGKPPVAAYAAGADLSAGTGATPSCLAIVNATTGEKVAEYANPHIDPTALAPVLTALCWMFKDEYGTSPLLAWEQQGPGVNFGGRVIELGYSNVYFRTAELPYTTRVEVSDRPGWVPTTETTMLLLEDYRTALATHEMINRSHQALEETLLFRYTAKGTVEHAEVESKDDPTGARWNHGDRVIADALAWKMVRTLGMGGRKPKPPEESVPILSLAWRRQLADNKGNYTLD